MTGEIIERSSLFQIVKFHSFIKAVLFSRRQRRQLTSIKQKRQDKNSFFVAFSSGFGPYDSRGRDNLSLFLPIFSMDWLKIRFIQIYLCKVNKRFLIIAYIRIDILISCKCTSGIEIFFVRVLNVQDFLNALLIYYETHLDKIRKRKCVTSNVTSHFFFFFFSFFFLGQYYVFRLWYTLICVRSWILQGATKRLWVNSGAGKLFESTAF